MEGAKKVIAIIIAVVLVVGAAGGYVYWKMGGTTSTDYDVEFEEGEELSESEEAESGSIQIPGYKSITIEAGTTEVSVELTNPEDNEVYFQISFYLPDTDETIYTSKLISPGQHLYNITLDRALEAGEYNLTVQYATFAMDDDLTPRNGAEVNCTLIAQ